MIFRPGRCKRAAGNRDGLLRIKQVGHTAIWEATGRLEKNENGIHVLTSLAKFLQIIYLKKSRLHLNFSVYSSPHIFYGWVSTTVSVAIVVHP
jgi:hypothetical protein